MRLLLDTHALIWWWDEKHRLSQRVLALLEAPENDVFVSSICALEIAIKVRLNQLAQMRDKIAIYASSVTADRFLHLPISAEHAVQAGLLMGEHRDPFDRVLAAQALTEDLVLVTRDREIARFGCKVLW